MLQHVFNDGGEVSFSDIDGIISKQKFVDSSSRSLFIFVNQVNKNGLTWFEFSARYRGVIERIQKIRQSEYRQFIFNLNQARDFLVFEKSFFFILFFFDRSFSFVELTIIFNALSFNEKLEPYELENFFESCDLSVTPGEIEEALQAVLQSKKEFLC